MSDRRRVAEARALRQRVADEMLIRDAVESCLLAAGGAALDALAARRADVPEPDVLSRLIEDRYDWPGPADA